MWRKRGLLVNPEEFKNPLMLSHAAVPTLLHLEGDYYRIYFASRDSQNMSRIYFADVIVDNDNIRVSRISEEPSLDLGCLGCFDEHGVMPSFAYTSESGDVVLYYIGIQRWSSVPFNSSTGLAFSTDGVKFERYSKAPILDRNEKIPFITTSPFVMKSGDIFKMWFAGGVRWIKEDKTVKHFYNIRYAESKDGINWNVLSTAIDFIYPEEYAIARPVVVVEDGLYKMWYSFRASPYGETYRIGYAESKDGIIWDRKDDLAGITVSKDDEWDGEMVCYAYVFTHKGFKFMLYNGNRYGKTGFGYAVWEEA